MKALKFLFSPVLMGILLLVLAIAMAVATFVENDFGAQSARAVVYNSHWFEALFLLLVVNLTGQIIAFRLYRRGKRTVMLFHLAFIVMVAGAALTRYTGFDGMMNIREGDSSRTVYSSDNHITFEVSGNDGSVIAHHSSRFAITALTDAKYRSTIRVPDGEIHLVYAGYRNDLFRKIEEAENGIPLVSLVLTRDMITSETVVLSEGEMADSEGFTIGFGVNADLRVMLQNGSFLVSAPSGLRVTRMTGMEVTIVAPDSAAVLEPRLVYSVGDRKLVLQDMTLSGIITAVENPNGNSGAGALEFLLTGGGKEKKIYLWAGDPGDDSEWSGEFGNHNVRVAYGSRELVLPFSIRLNDFILDRYPGSNTPSGYRSNVTLADQEHKTEINYEIYMNHILKYRGYRFYQSAFDKDEKGTILSVNHDRPGMLTTYTGYFLLFLFIILSVVNRKSFFNTVSQGHWGSRLRKPLVVTLLMSLHSFTSPAGAQELITEKSDADAFGRVLAQDQKGRTKPLYTISNDILRKVAKENSLNGLSSMQVFLGYSLDFIHWQSVPLIKVSNAELREALKLKEERAAFSDIVDFNVGGGYKLAPYIEKAYSKKENERSRFDKEVIKLDERINICYMMARGDFMKIFPLRDRSDIWGTAEMAAGYLTDEGERAFVSNVIPLWAQSVANAGKEKEADEFLSAIMNYQREHSTYELPSEFKVGAELFYYKSMIFERLFPFYSTLGLVMIITLITAIIRGRQGRSLFLKVLIALVAAGFAMHTAGLAIRWYISGHSPMSNGYESMLFISWVTLLAGFIFSRRSMLTLAATSVLGGMTLMVAHLSFMDPEITNLVPVLKSYLLTLHVSVITGSYGFLGLGAILGLIVMIMMLFVNGRNRTRISTTIDELTVINYKSLTLGLYLLTIGTFLGAIWANESWGRYWGWDPKETWSLITIIVYTLVTHSRLIPGMKDTYIFNLISLFAFSSVLMTYFGVNYYLSGLHSYAGGDPVPVPVFVYVTVFLLIVISAVSGFRYLSLISEQE